MYAFFKENTILNIADLGLKIGDVVTVICVGGGGGGGGGGSTNYHNSKYPGGGVKGEDAGYHMIYQGYDSGMGYGAGGAGGNGAEGGSGKYNGAGGGGGGAGEVIMKTVVLNSQMIPITVGDRGLGGGINNNPLGNGYNGGNGGTSSFGNYVTGHGGLGGGGGGGSNASYSGAGGVGGLSGTFTDYSPGRGGNGGRGSSNASYKIRGGLGAHGFLPFLAWGPSNGEGGVARNDSYIYSQFTNDVRNVDFTTVINRTTYLGGDYGINNFGRGLVMLLWD